MRITFNVPEDGLSYTELKRQLGQAVLKELVNSHNNKSMLSRKLGITRTKLNQELKKPLEIGYKVRKSNIKQIEASTYILTAITGMGNVKGLTQKDRGLYKLIKEGFNTAKELSSVTGQSTGAFNACLRRMERLGVIKRTKRAYM